MVSDLMAAITASGDTDATRIGTSVLDALDRDHLAALGADPADLDALDRLRATTSSRDGDTTMAPTQASGAQVPSPDRPSAPLSTPAAETPTETSSSAASVQPGAPINRTQTSNSSTDDSTSGSAIGAGQTAAESAGQDASTASGPQTGSSSPAPGSVSSSIAALTAQARAAAAVDPVAADLLDALDRNTTSADLTQGRAGDTPSSTDPDGNDTVENDTVENGTAGEQPHRTTPRDEPPPKATDRGVTTPATDSTFDKLAHCESGGDWSTNTGNGYHGVIRTDLQRDDVDHCSSGLGGVFAGIWTSISATLLSKLVS